VQPRTKNQGIMVILTVFAAKTNSKEPQGSQINLEFQQLLDVVKQKRVSFEMP
jgi:hypothetical protein